MIQNINNIVEKYEKCKKINIINNIENALLNKEYKKNNTKFLEIQDAFLRSKAEVENIKRRFQKEAKKIYKFSIEEFSKSLLSVKDSLENALTVKITTIESIKNDITIILNLLTNIFKKNNLIEIYPKLGDKFDPMKHEVISVVKTKNNENGIVEVLQKGYMINNRLLRPAFVIVSKIKE